MNIQGYPQRMGQERPVTFKSDDSKIELRLNVVFMCLIQWLDQKETSESYIKGNRQFKFCTIVSEVSSFVGNPVVK